ncbi:MAG TPA: hypothetical protein DEA52_04395 [Clostridiaceae bacterium]|jgi:hypothetical protein|nr:hypothetical protein [Clostridiaceae bacterium]
MSITIKRNTGWSGTASGIQIKINDKKVASINEKRSLEIQLHDEHNYIQVTQFGLKSKKVDVEKGDILEIKQSWWHKMSFPFSLLIYFLVMFIPDLRSKLIAILTLGIMLVFSLYIFNGFKIIVLNRENSE